MNIEHLQKNWDALGRESPLWAILTSSRQWRETDFFMRGAAEITELIEYLDVLGMRLSYKRALDFGCGVGRLTQALAKYFEQVAGVDIAPSMIEAARRYNLYGDRCRYYHNSSADLALFSSDSFDLIYSNITLQHISPAYARSYIREFVRLLAPGGVAVFQLPSELIDTPGIKTRLKALAPAPLLARYRSAKFAVVDLLRRQPRMEMYGIQREQVMRLLTDLGAQIVDVKLDRRETAHRRWICYQYCARKV